MKLRITYPKLLRYSYWDSAETKGSKKFWRLAWKIEQERK
jgi:hypothetical protein